LLPGKGSQPCPLHPLFDGSYPRWLATPSYLLMVTPPSHSWLPKLSYSCSLYRLGADPIDDSFQQFFTVAPRVLCHRNVFTGRSLATAISSGSTILVFQLPCHNTLYIVAGFLLTTKLDMMA
jgi:hypothetical protein